MKKLIALLMSAAMVLSLAACGSSDTNTNDTTDDTTNQTDTNTGDTTGDTTGDSTGVIKIGGIGPLTGSAATYGIATKEGAEIAVNEINALGGLQFELDFQDDEGDAEKATYAYSNLKDNGMQILYGCTTTTPCVSVAAETFNERYFQLTPSASSTDVTAGKDNVFQMCFTDPDQGVTAAD